MSATGDAHNNGDCWAPTCPICADEGAHWTCEAHGVTTTGDCRECDDELIALTTDQVTRSEQPGNLDD